MICPAEHNVSTLLAKIRYRKCHSSRVRQRAVNYSFFAVYIYTHVRPSRFLTSYVAPSCEMKMSSPDINNIYIPGVTKTRLVSVAASTRVGRL